MGWKIIHLTKPCKIKVKDENLLLTFLDTENEENIKVTLKDIDFILFDNTQFSITGKALELLAKNNIATLFIDETFHPSSILIPYHQHSTMPEIATAQIRLSDSFKGTVWQEIVKVKLKNQADVLNLFDSFAFEKIMALMAKVENFDQTYQEAQGARVYWKNLFDTSFRRDQESEDILNAMLNYGYATLRACMARSISASGLLPIFGIWHKNKYNAFCLADDLMESFRPIVDISVKQLYEKNPLQNKVLNKEIKKDIVSILTHENVIINAGVSSLVGSIDLFVRHYKKAVINQNPSLIIHPALNRKFFKNECI